MRRLGPFAMVTIAAFVGAAVTLLMARGVGMPGDEVIHLGQLLIPAIAATIAMVLVASPLVRNATIRTRFVALALISVVVAVTNLGVLAALMLVKHDALLIATLVGYSGAVGIGAALALSRSFRAGILRLVGGAEAIARGDLSSRIGEVDGGPELNQLATTLDTMTANLQETIAREQKAVAMRQDLITAVSHDLRTPLAGLRAMVEAIDDEVVDDPATLRRYSREMRRSLGVLTTLVDDLFELVQLDSGAVRAETERTTVGEVVSLALAACGAGAVDKQVNLRTDIAAAEAELVSPRLTRALQNLVQNAVRHTPSDGTVRISGHILRDAIELTVEDDGDGIDEVVLERIFEPFWRGDASRAESGAGLGLTLAKRVVEALGGRVSAQSIPGRGSRFALVVPATPSITRTGPRATA